jgi:hypothetical protein
MWLRAASPRHTGSGLVSTVTQASDRRCAWLTSSASASVSVQRGFGISSAWPTSDSVPMVVVTPPACSHALVLPTPLRSHA